MSQCDHENHDDTDDDDSLDCQSYQPTTAKRPRQQAAPSTMQDQQNDDDDDDSSIDTVELQRQIRQLAKKRMKQTRSQTDEESDELSVAKLPAARVSSSSSKRQRINFDNVDTKEDASDDSDEQEEVDECNDDDFNDDDSSCDTKELAWKILHPNEPYPHKIVPPPAAADEEFCLPDQDDSSASSSHETLPDNDDKGANHVAVNNENDPSVATAAAPVAASIPTTITLDVASRDDKPLRFNISSQTPASTNSNISNPYSKVRRQSGQYYTSAPNTAINESVQQTNEHHAPDTAINESMQQTNEHESSKPFQNEPPSDHQLEAAFFAEGDEEQAPVDYSQENQYQPARQQPDVVDLCSDADYEYDRQRPSFYSEYAVPREDIVRNGLYANTPRQGSDFLSAPPPNDHLDDDICNFSDDDCANVQTFGVTQRTLSQQVLQSNVLSQDPFQHSSMMQARHAHGVSAAQSFPLQHPENDWQQQQHQQQYTSVSQPFQSHPTHRPTHPSAYMDAAMRSHHVEAPSNRRRMIRNATTSNAAHASGIVLPHHNVHDHVPAARNDITGGSGVEAGVNGYFSIQRSSSTWSKQAAPAPSGAWNVGRQNNDGGCDNNDDDADNAPAFGGWGSASAGPVRGGRSRGGGRGQKGAGRGKGGFGRKGGWGRKGKGGGKRGGRGGGSGSGRGRGRGGRNGAGAGSNGGWTGGGATAGRDDPNLGHIGGADIDF
ncbi:hypothetical protein MPSEU_000167300 [Mayamaea pseudoterrestris]|nr:hypothetical protein MPSEU_000167300 [Mayamaea pseudoterrestris]